MREYHQYTRLSCGIRLLGQLDSGKFAEAPKPTCAANAKNIVREVATQINKGHQYSTIVFSHRANDEWFNALINLIEDKKLGELVKNTPIRNRNTNAIIQTCIWNFDIDAMNKFLNTRKKRAPAKKRAGTRSRWAI